MTINKNLKPSFFSSKCCLTASNKTRLATSYIIESSRNRGYPQIIHLNRIFHYKPSISGYPNLEKTTKWPLQVSTILGKPPTSLASLRLVKMIVNTGGIFWVLSHQIVQFAAIKVVKISSTLINVNSIELNLVNWDYSVYCSPRAHKDSWHWYSCANSVSVANGNGL